MEGIFYDGARIGTVAKFAGEPQARRWVAWSTVSGRQNHFSSRTAAMNWLLTVHRESAEQRREGAANPSVKDEEAGRG